MPNQQSWIFCWVLSVVFPRLVPKHITQNIKIIISDGDPQEYSQIDNATKMHFPSVTRVRCGWHIVAKGFEKHVDMTFPDVSSNLLEDHRRIIFSWIYSWMKCNCETYLEFKYSYFLFMKYLFSPVVTSTFGHAFPNNIASFLRKYVLTWEKWILFCYRKHIRHYGEYSNTPLEGTNFSIKHSAISTHPQLSLENSFQIISRQSKKKISSVQSDVLYQSKTQPTHHKLSAVHSKLTIAGSEELRNIEIKSKYYVSYKISDVEWCVIRDSSTFKELEKMVVPIFNRKYTVKLCQETQLHCSCSYSDVWGLPCEHMLCVATSIKPH